MLANYSKSWKENRKRDDEGKKKGDKRLRSATIH